MHDVAALIIIYNYIKAFRVSFFIEVASIIFYALEN
jgi:hypothetical protein